MAVGWVVWLGIVLAILKKVPAILKEAEKLLMTFRIQENRKKPMLWNW